MFTEFIKALANKKRNGVRLRRRIRAAITEGDEEFFERFSSIRIQYENSERKTIEEFQFSPEVTDGQAEDEQLWPTIGGWNTEDLYSEILYALVHTSHSQSNEETDKIISYLQQVFHIESDHHEKLLQNAKDKQPPPLVLNLEVVEANGLKAKDINGLSDPFCTLYLSSNPLQKFNTSMKPETLEPIWREYFSLPVTQSQDESLIIEVWDFDPEESVSDKMRKFSEVKSTKGLKVLMKEIKMSASAGKQQHEFLGCLTIPLKNIPSNGLDQYFTLDGRNGSNGKKKGQVHLRMALGAEKEKKVAAQEYRSVLHLLLVNQLNSQNYEPYQWNGEDFTKESQFILQLLQLGGGLTTKDVDIARWLVYSRVHCDHPLHTQLFPTIFDTMISHIKNKSIGGDEELRKFWFVTKKLVENFTGFFKNLHQSFFGVKDVKDLEQTYYMLRTLHLLRNYLTTKKESNVELESMLTLDFIQEKVIDAISRGAEELFVSLVPSIDNENNNEEGEDNQLETMMEGMIQLGQLLIADLRKSLETVQTEFKEALDVNFFDITYMIYDRKYCELVRPIVDQICGKLKCNTKSDMESGILEDKDASMGTSLFELYLALKQFSDLSSNLSMATAKCEECLCISGIFHNWFHSGVVQWLELACCKALNRIKRAVHLDNLLPVDDMVKFSSSAVDTAHVFHQIQIFWDQLCWPEVEGSYTFVAKILDDMCRCMIYYAKTTCSKVAELELAKEQESDYEISDELCLAINNIEWVAKEMKSVSEKLDTNKIICELASKNGQVTSEQCKRTLDTVMDNSVENVNNKILQTIEGVGNKMRPVIRRMLVEGCESTDIEEEGIDQLLKYLDKNLIKIKNKLLPVTFEKTFNILWETSLLAVYDLVQITIERKRPPSFFVQIGQMLQILTNFFYPGTSDNFEDNSEYQKIINLTSIYGTQTSQLMLQYTQQRYQTQQNSTNSTFGLGSLTVRSDYCPETQTLRVEILNAKNLKPHDSNGQCDPFIKLTLIPQLLNSPPIKYKTKVKKRTLFPLFDETLQISISEAEKSTSGFLHFVLRDHETFRRNEFLGECFLPLECIPQKIEETELQDLKQIYLNFTVPIVSPKNDNTDILILTALENRQQWDKVATDFAKKERAKMTTT